MVWTVSVHRCSVVGDRAQVKRQVCGQPSEVVPLTFTMDSSDIAHMLALLPSGEAGLPGLLRRLAAEVRRILDADVCRVWMVDSRERANNGFRLAERVVRQPADRAVPDIHVTDPDAIHASLPAQGAIETSRDGRSIARVRLASIGFVEAARANAAIAPSELAEVRAFVAQLEGEVEARFPAEELESFRQWLRVRGAIDRRAARAFAQVQTIEELAEMVDALSEELTPAEYSGLYFIDPDTGNLRLAYGRGLNAAERAAAEATAMERHPGIVMRTGRVVDVPDTSIERSDGMPSGHGREVRSRLFIPVLSDGRVVGTIGFASSTPHAYTSRHRQILAFLADFAGFSYGRITAQRAMVRRGELLEAANTAAERLLGAQEWEPASYAALALIGSALDANAVALVELSNAEGVASLPSNSSSSSVSTSATGQQSAPEPIEFAWQPTFGFPWLRGARIRSLSAQERSDLATDRGIFIDSNDGGPALLLKPVFVESALWGVIAHEPKPGVARLIDRAERSALRALARAFGAAIARERLAKAVTHQQKMDAVGRLASGVAQDFSQQLWPILLYTEMLERSPGLDDRARHVLAEMRVAARRASELVEQVLAISRQRDRLIDLVHVAEIAIEVSHELRKGAPDSVEMTTSIDPDSGCILGDPEQTRRGLLALGHVVIAACRDRVDRATPSVLKVVVGQVARNGRDFVRIAYECGDALHGDVSSALIRGEETQELRRVIEDSGGTITFEHGSEIEILLPRVPADAKTNAGVAGFAAFAVESSSRTSGGTALDPQVLQPDSSAASSAPSSAASPTASLEASPKVLFVDDDAAVLEVVREVLEVLGYAVTACRDASAALAQLSSGWLPDIVLTDLTMPGMNGIELTREIRKRGFEMPIVCCTGFLDDASEHAGTLAGMCAFVRKPVDCDELDRTLRDAIEKERRLRRRG